VYGGFAMILIFTTGIPFVLVACLELCVVEREREDRERDREWKEVKKNEEDEKKKKREGEE
jgi:hypothetical protein